MDYLSQSFLFKLRKVLRYVRLYGPRRTWVKVRGQYHMKKRYARLPTRPSPSPRGGHVGIIGCGNFAFCNVAFVLSHSYGSVIRACMDIDIHRAASLAMSYGARYYLDRSEGIMADPEIDLVYVASNHATHADYAIEALRAGKAVHVEKPHCVDEDQLHRLCRAMVEAKGRLALGFNRPGSRLGTLIRHYLSSQPGPAMLNWFVAGHKIDPAHWYFHEKEGGRVLGNLCHWTDFLLQMVPEEARFPITITPTRGSSSDADVAVTYLFGDGTIAALTFSAKGHAFEGVRERFAAHKGDVLIAMDDFRSLTVDILNRKRRYSGWFRDHGHAKRIRDSYAMARGEDEGESVAYVWETGQLFLKTREALEKNERITVRSYAERPEVQGSDRDALDPRGWPVSG